MNDTVPEDFDPYRKWLGIPPEEQPPSHYRLLGIAPYESDPDVISNAADRCMAHVRTYQTGSRAGLSQGILNELAEARLCLLNAEKKQAYDAQLRTQRAPAPPPPQPAAAAVPVAPQPVAPVPVAVSPSAEPDVSSFGSGRSSTSVRLRRKRSSPAPILIAMAAAVALVVVLIVALNNRNSSPDSTGSQAGSVSSHSDGWSEADQGRGGTRRTKRTRIISHRPTPGDSSEGIKETEKVADEAGGRFEFSGFDTVLRSAREAAAQHEYGKARQALDRAAEKYKGGKASTRIDNVRKLVDYMEAFHTALLDAARSLEPDTTLGGMGERKITFVRFDSEPAPTVVIEAGGEETAIPIDDLSPALALRIARGQLQNDPKNKLYLGTYLALRSVGSRFELEINNLWYQAIEEGLASEALVAELDLPYRIEKRREPVVSRVLPGTRLAVPGDAELLEANRKIREVFKDEFAEAKSTAQKTDLAARLYEAARNSNGQEPAEQYALLRKALELNIELVNLQQVFLTAKELTNRFEIDLLELLSASLVKCNAAASSIDQGVEIYESASNLFFEAKVACRYDIAERAAKVALSAARRGKQWKAANAVEQELRKLDAIRPLLDAANEAQAVLAVRPDDPQACTALGRLECFIKDNWQDGLPMLVKGSDQELASLATLDLKRPVEADDQIELAHKWQAQAEAATGPVAHAMLNRARFWLEMARVRLSGLEAAAVKKQIDDIDKMLKGA